MTPIVVRLAPVTRLAAVVGISCAAALGRNMDNGFIVTFITMPLALGVAAHVVTVTIVIEGGWLKKYGFWHPQPRRVALVGLRSAEIEDIRVRDGLAPRLTKDVLRVRARGDQVRVEPSYWPRRLRHVLGHAMDLYRDDVPGAFRCPARGGCEYSDRSRVWTRTEDPVVADRTTWLRSVAIGTALTGLAALALLVTGDGFTGRALVLLVPITVGVVALAANLYPPRLRDDD